MKQLKLVRIIRMIKLYSTSNELTLINHSNSTRTVNQSKFNFSVIIKRKTTNLVINRQIEDQEIVKQIEHRVYHLLHQNKVNEAYNLVQESDYHLELYEFHLLIQRLYSNSKSRGNLLKVQNLFTNTTFEKEGRLTLMDYSLWLKVLFLLKEYDSCMKLYTTILQKFQHPLLPSVYNIIFKVIDKQNQKLENNKVFQYYRLLLLEGCSALFIGVENLKYVIEILLAKDQLQEVEEMVDKIQKEFNGIPNGIRHALVISCILQGKLGVAEEYFEVYFKDEESIDVEFINGVLKALYQAKLPQLIIKEWMDRLMKYQTKFNAVTIHRLAKLSIDINSSYCNEACLQLFLNFGVVPTNTSIILLFYYSIQQVTNISQLNQLLAIVYNSHSPTLKLLLNQLLTIKQSSLLRKFDIKEWPVINKENIVIYNIILKRLMQLNDDYNGIKRERVFEEYTNYLIKRELMDIYTINILIDYYSKKKDLSMIQMLLSFKQEIDTYCPVAYDTIDYYFKKEEVERNNQLWENNSKEITVYSNVNKVQKYIKNKQWNKMEHLFLSLIIQNNNSNSGFLKYDIKLQNYLIEQLSQYQQDTKVLNIIDSLYKKQMYIDSNYFIKLLKQKEITKNFKLFELIYNFKLTISPTFLFQFIKTIIQNEFNLVNLIQQCNTNFNKIITSTQYQPVIYFYLLKYFNTKLLEYHNNQQVFVSIINQLIEHLEFIYLDLSNNSRDTENKETVIDIDNNIESNRIYNNTNNIDNDYGSIINKENIIGYNITNPNIINLNKTTNEHEYTMNQLLILLIDKSITLNLNSELKLIISFIEGKRVILNNETLLSAITKAYLYLNEMDKIIRLLPEILSYKSNWFYFRHKVVNLLMAQLAQQQEYDSIYTTLIQIENLYKTKQSNYLPDNYCLHQLILGCHFNNNHQKAEEYYLYFIKEYQIVPDTMIINQFIYYNFKMEEWSIAKEWFNKLEKPNSFSFYLMAKVYEGLEEMEMSRIYYCKMMKSNKWRE